ncbi:MAG: protease complex subunit PrcB family protein [Myxococcales bacterium]|nr:protease complex subunit PrcB family protein [Myxococcales bacterium]
MTANSLLKIVTPLCLLAACNAAQDDDLVDENGGFVADAEGANDRDLKADHLTVSFTPFSDGIGDSGMTESRRIFTSAKSYRSYFGHDAPGVNFDKEWVVFHSAGVRNSGGFKASIASVSRSASGLTLKVVTAIESPGPGCAVTFALTKPYVLARVKIPAQRPTYVAYYRNDSIRTCAPPAAKCAADADCRLAGDYCTSCACRALAPSESLSSCAGPGVRCFADPCLGKRPVCQSGHCVPAAAAAAPVKCGNATCTGGMVCCNASCGICTKPGDFCIQTAC